MKYLKYVVAAFVLSIGLSCMGVSGVGIVMMNNVKIPILNGIYTSNSVINKTDTSYPQELERKYCLDDIGQNQRAVEGRVIVYGPASSQESNLASAWRNIPDKSTVAFDSASQQNKPYQLQLKATTTSFTTATFYGTWYF